jgi:hypothetical protein
LSSIELQRNAQYSTRERLGRTRDVTSGYNGGCRGKTRASLGARRTPLEPTRRAREVKSSPRGRGCELRGTRTAPHDARRVSRIAERRSPEALRRALGLGRRALVAARGCRQVASDPRASPSGTRGAGRGSRRTKRTPLRVTRSPPVVTRAALGVTGGPRRRTTVPRDPRRGSRGLKGASLGSIRRARRARVARLGVPRGTRSNRTVPLLVRPAPLRASGRPLQVKCASLAGAGRARCKPRVPLGARGRAFVERCSARDGIRWPLRARRGALQTLTSSRRRARWALGALSASLHGARGPLSTPRASLLVPTVAQIKPSEPPLEPRGALVSSEAARRRKSVPHEVLECVAP